MQWKKLPDKQKFAILAVLLIASFTLFALSLQQGPKQNPSVQDTNIPDQENQPAANIPLQNKNTATKNTNQPTKAQPGHDEAVKEYAGRVLQFNKCVYSAPATNPTFKNNTTIMLDGWFSAEAQTITLDGKKYALKAHSFVYATLNYTNLPHTVSIDCSSPAGPRYNIGTILLQR